MNLFDGHLFYPAPPLFFMLNFSTNFIFNSYKLNPLIRSALVTHIRYSIKHNTPLRKFRNGVLCYLV